MSDYEKQHVVNVWNRSSIIEPHQLRRYMLDFILLYIVVFIVASVAVFTTLALIPPSATSAPWQEVVKASMKMFAHKLTGGMLWPVEGKALIQNIFYGSAEVAMQSKLAAAGALGALVAWLLSKDSLRPRDGYKHIRGSMLWRGADAEQRFKARIQKGSEEYIHPQVKVGKQALGTGLIIIGSPGSGKTVLLTPYIDRLMKTNAKLLTLDVKGGEQIEQWKSIHYIAPWLKGSLIPDIGQDCATEGDCGALADALIAEGGKGGEIWTDAARIVVRAVLFSLIREKPLAWGWKDLNERLSLTQEGLRDIVRKHDIANLATVDSGSDATDGSVAFTKSASLKNFSRAASLFDECERHGGRKFSVKKWIYQKDYKIRQFVLCHNKSEQSMAFIAPWIINMISMEINNAPDGTDDRKYMILDEFAQISRTDIAPFLEVGRSKGFQTVIALQDWAQVEEKFKEKSKTIFSSASVKLILKIGTSDAQEQISKRLGTREVAITNTSFSTSRGSAMGLNSSTSVAEKTQPLMMPSQLAGELGPLMVKVNGKDAPKAIRGLLLPDGAENLEGDKSTRKADIYMLDFPAVLLEKQRKKPSELPSKHRAYQLVLNVMQDESEPIQTRLANARAALIKQGEALSDFALAGMLFSARFIDRDTYKKCAAKGAAASVLAGLKDKKKQVVAEPVAQAVEGTVYTTDGLASNAEKCESVSINNNKESTMKYPAYFKENEINILTRHEGEMASLYSKLDNIPDTAEGKEKAEAIHEQIDRISDKMHEIKKTAYMRNADEYAKKEIARIKAEDERSERLAQAAAAAESETKAYVEQHMKSVYEAKATGMSDKEIIAKYSLAVEEDDAAEEARKRKADEIRAKLLSRKQKNGTSGGLT